jgi:hypothetical protein
MLPTIIFALALITSCYTVFKFAVNTVVFVVNKETTDPWPWTLTMCIAVTLWSDLFYLLH